MTLGDIRYPDILQQTVASNTAVILLKIPGDLAYLQGHFRTMPITPGVVQLHWAVKFASQLFAIHEVVTGGSQIKFSNLLQPYDEALLTLENSVEKKSITYHYKSADKLYSSGRFTYE